MAKKLKRAEVTKLINKNQLLTQDDVNSLRAKLGELSNDELSAQFTELNDDYAEATFKFDKKQHRGLIDFFEGTATFNAKAELAGYASTIYETLKEGEGLNANEIKSLQKIILGCTWNNIKEAGVLFAQMKTLQETNIILMNYDMIFRQYSEFMNRQAQEVKTGLQHKEGDAELAAKAEIAKV